jgi:pimeloyl-ACP methyl ester carboxylesterase
LALNTFEVRFPVSALRGERWRVGAAIGTWGGDAWSAVVDLAFVHEPVADASKASCWLDRAQSEAIADRQLPTASVDTRRLGAGYSDEQTLRRGPMIRLHVPSIGQTEGISGQPRYGQDFSQSIYRGAYQPYAAYVPKSYDPSRANPLIMLLHCLTCNHMTYHLASWPGLRDLAESRGAVIVTPLAYGEGGHYEGEAEWDVFDVLADVSTRYRIDPDRLYLTGFSMGSLGTYRLALLYPDLWARAFGVGNYTNPFCVTPNQSEPNYCGFAPFNYFTVLENARNLPFGVLNGWLDYLTPIVGATEIADRLDELGYTYRFWQYPTRSHEASLHGLTTNVTDPFFGKARRIADPAHVTYIVDRTMSAPDWRIAPDRAYWVSEIRLASRQDRGTVDARSGRGSVFARNDFSSSGSSPGGPYIMRGRDGAIRKLDGPNRLSLVLRGISSLRVDPAATGLVLSPPLKVTIDTDVPVRLWIVGRDDSVRVSRGRHTVTIGR